MQVCLARILWFAPASERRHYTLVSKAWRYACCTASTPCIKLAVPKLYHVPKRMPLCDAAILYWVKRKLAKGQRIRVAAALGKQPKRFISWRDPVSCKSEWTPLWRFGFSPAGTVVFLRSVSISSQSAAYVHLRYLGQQALRPVKHGRVAWPSLVFDPLSFYVPEILVCDSRHQRIQSDIQVKFCYDFEMPAETCETLLNALRSLQTQHLLSRRVSTVRPQAHWAPHYIRGQAFSRQFPRPTLSTPDPH